VAHGTILAHVRGRMHAPTGPLAGDRKATATVVLVRGGDEHRITAFHNAWWRRAERRPVGVADQVAAAASLCCLGLIPRTRLNAVLSA
jgi:hypothetical protein